MNQFFSFLISFFLCPNSGPKKLSTKAALLLIMVDLLVDKNSLQCLWAGLHPGAIQLQQIRLRNFKGT